MNRCSKSALGVVVQKYRFIIYLLNDRSMHEKEEVAGIWKPGTVSSLSQVNYIYSSSWVTSGNRLRFSTTGGERYASIVDTLKLDRLYAIRSSTGVPSIVAADSRLVCVSAIHSQP